MRYCGSFVLLCVLALPAGCSGDDGESVREAALRINADAILQDVKALSSDEMEGRAAGTAGEDKAAEYLQKRFQEIGLQPVEGSYTQAVRMVGTKKLPEQSRLTITGPDGKELGYENDQTLTYWSTSQKDVVDIENAPLLFVGYGVEAPEYGWDDFKGQDVAGKVLLFLNDDPPVSEDGKDLFEGERRTYYGRWTYKYEQAMKHGAAGAIMIHTTPSASYGWQVVQHNGAEEGFALDIPGSGYQVDLLGWIDEATSNRIAQSMVTTVEGLFEQGAKRDFQPLDTGYRVNCHIETNIRRIETKNVMGMLEGSDTGLKSQVIVFSAHYDHLGVNPDLEGDDKIFNGAWDNAAGTSSILSLAEAFSSLPQPPRRSILFLACAAEESGSLGSRGFVADPPIDRSRLVADFNIDMPQIFGVTSDISAIGVETNTLGDALRQAAAEFEVDGKPVEVRGDPRPRAGSFYRSDQVNFAKAGIPALFINPGTEYSPPLDFDPAEYRNQVYHQVSDEVDEHWDLSGLVRDLRIVFRAAERVADADEMPRWKPGNEFEDAWKKLHE